MATNPYVNKVLLADGTSVIDISDTTATASDVLNSKYFYTASGQKVQGTATRSTAAISVVDTLDSGGGTIREITALDISDTTAVASDVASGKYFYTASGVKTQGTASGGGGGATQHVIHLEFTDNTDTDIDVYYDDSLISTMITAYNPSTYGGKTVSLAQLDNVTWYEPSSIPIGVELIDFSKTTNDYVVNSTGAVVAEQWYSVSDYTPVSSGMTFTYSGCYWFYIGLYDESKNILGSVSMYSDGTQRQDNQNICDGVLSGNELPSDVAYVRITSTYNPDSTILSLIRTA